MATEPKLLEAMAALTAQLKSIIEMRKGQLNKDKHELLSSIRSPKDSNTGRD
jgi:hypothetical protein